MPRERKGSLKMKNSSVANSDNSGNDNEQANSKPSGNKKRRTSTAASSVSSNAQLANANSIVNSGNNNGPNAPSQLIPPQPSTMFGETIVASNPFDDSPSTHPQSQPSSQTSSAPPTPNTPLPPMPPQQPKPVPIMSGKIYPPDQPMVFNPANPNAPPIYPCGICHKEVHDNDQAILCESGCNFWFHRVCTGISEAAYHLLTAEVYAEWVCDKCMSTKNIPLVKFKP